MPSRHIWIGEIPSRWDNTTHSEMSAKEEDVRALREKTAAALFAKIDVKVPDAKNVNGILEVLSYSKKPGYLDAAKSLCAGYDAWLKSLSPKDIAANRTYIAGTLKGFDVLIRNKVIGANDYPLRATLEQLYKQLNKKK